MFATSRGQPILLLMFVASSALLQSDGVYHQEGTIGKGHNREKRLSEGINGFNTEQKSDILEQHNHFRALTKASNMLKLMWDPQLEHFAQSYAAQCKFEHNSDRQNVAGFQYVGENLYAGTGDFDPKAVVQQWYSEINDYDYSSNTCTPGRGCGHYTQVVWAKTSAMGCGVTYCPRFNQARKIGFTEGFLVVCNYGPGGNYIGEKPYEAGTPCSQCPSGTTCGQGLCASP
ncbi:hypothetical protein BsWGS_22757 [Bradybaena similaris]